MKFSDVIEDYKACANNKIDVDGENFLAFLHVPKTAGTSLLAALKKEYPHNFHMSYDQIDEKLDEFINEQRSKNYDFFTGHFAIRHARKMWAADLKYSLITFIREPISRLISDYRYQKTELHPPHKEFIAKYPTFESWVLDVPPNIQLKKLMGFIDNVDEGYYKLLTQYAFIGVTELYDLSVNVLGGITGRDFTSTPKKLNVTEKLSINEINPSEKLIEKLNEIHYIDIQIYNRIYSHFARIANDYIGI